MNGRCGIGPGSDFGDPEYTTFSSVSQVKWESSAGMDPYSYGYNRATAAGSYMNVSTMINNLVDIVSKNGNYLLDIGYVFPSPLPFIICRTTTFSTKIHTQLTNPPPNSPKADGTIDATEIATLKAGGAWIHAHAESIFNTTYYFPTAELGANIRFTQTAEAFYIFSFTQPDEQFVVDTALPILEGDVVTMIGNGNGTVLDWAFVQGGEGVVIDVPAEVAEMGEWCWVFKVEYVA